MWKFTGKQRPDFAETPSAGQESVWDYPRPPICILEKRTVKVRVGPHDIATSTAAMRVLETASPPTVYLPPADINFEQLERSESGGSFCEWKGRATYWSLLVDGHKFENVGWSYESPTKAFSDIVGYLSFYPAALECWLAEERVRPQPGGFYGGWVTNEIVGPYKGEPGTSGW